MILRGYGLMYTTLGMITDPPTESRWVMADAALGGGGAVHVELASDIYLGAEAAFARTRYERRPGGGGSTVVADGRAGVSTFLLVARLSGDGLGSMGRLVGVGWIGRVGYLSAGIGAITYDLEDLEDPNTDFLFSAAGGIELATSSGRGVFVEVRQLWTFHEREGVESGTVRHRRVDLGVRLPLQ